MKKLLSIIFSFLLLGQFNALKAQRTFYRTYKVEDGLVSSTVYDIHQDKLGFIWFGTEAGLSKFDGIRFVNYSKKSGLGDNEIFNIHEDSKDRLWFFPFNGRLSYFTPDHQIIIDPDKDSLLQNLVIRSTFSSFFEAEDGSIWMGTNRDRKIAYYNTTKSALIDCPHRNVIIKSVKHDELVYLSKGTYYKYELKWNDGIPELADELSSREIVPSKPDNGLKKIEGFQITDQLLDREGNLWYSTLGNGVLMKTRSSVRLVDSKTGLSHNHVYSLSPSLDSSILVGYQNGELQLWTTQDTHSIKLGDYAYNRLIDILLDDHLWIATDKALFVLNPKNLQVIDQYSGSVKCLQFYKDQVYYGTANGLFKLDKTTRVEPKRIYNQRTISVLIQNEKSIFIGTNQGLKFYNGDSVAMVEGEGIPKLLNGRVKSMCSIGDSSILFATAEGLVYLNGSQYHVWSSDNSGLSSDVCNLIVKESDTTIWVGTNHGLNRLRFRESEIMPLFDNYSTEEGLLSNYINDISLDLKNIYIGTDMGVSIFPRGLDVQHHKPVSYILGVNINDHDTLLQDHYELEYYQNKIHLSISGIAFESGKNTKYMYRLNGLSKTWSTTSLSEIQFEALRPGNYTFEVYAVALDGTKSDKAAQISFKIHKPFYDEWWFILSAIAAILISIGIVVRFIIKYLSRKGLEEKNKQLEEKNEIIQHEKERSEELLLNILPEATANELKQYGKVKAKSHEGATVFFSDFKGFTSISEQLSPEELVEELDYCFRAYDEIMEKHHIEKIKTIGDAYMCATGLENGNRSKPVDMIHAALDVVEFMESYIADKKQKGEPYFQARIGIHCGGVVSGVVGLKKFAFDIWGDTVNTAARMESSGEVGKINISKSTYEIVKDHFDCTPRGKVEAKGKGSMEMYFVNKRKAD